MNSNVVPIYERVPDIELMKRDSLRDPARHCAELAAKALNEACGNAAAAAGYAREGASAEVIEELGRMFDSLERERLRLYALLGKAAYVNVFD